jgi:adenine-specific DNA-methyltransferase
MDYIGSKEKLNDWIFSKINLYFDKSQFQNLYFLDACAGSGSVSKYAASLGFNVLSNDIMNFSYHIVRGNLMMDDVKYQQAEKYIKQMNELKGIEGFFFENYSKTSGRLYLSDDNAKKIDDCRNYIITIDDDIIQSYLLFCMMEAMSRVLNTTGVQAAFLKNYKTRALGNFEIRPEKYISAKWSMTYNEDIFNLLKDSQFKNNHLDILYLDPPYNSRQYAPNYHLYETLARYDKPTLKGKTGLREEWKKEANSLFCSKSTCLSFLKDIIEETTAKMIFVSYNSDGLINIEEMLNYLLQNNLGSVDVCVKPYKRYKSNSDTELNTNDSFLKEYLFAINKEDRI